MKDGIIIDQETAVKNRNALDRITCIYYSLLLDIPECASLDKESYGRLLDLIHSYVINGYIDRAVTVPGDLAVIWVEKVRPLFYGGTKKEARLRMRINKREVDGE